MAEMKVFKVKNLKTGEFRTAGGGWSKFGKTWNNLGHLKASLATTWWYREDSEEAIKARKNYAIIEIVIVESEDNVTPMDDFVDKLKRAAKLREQYGRSFTDLVERIEKDGQSKDWQWVLIIPQNNRHPEYRQEMLDYIKSQKLKLGKDVRKADADQGGIAVAFKEKKHAMAIKLAMETESGLVGIDIQTFMETNLDE
jgi:hypothetical protein